MRRLTPRFRFFLPPPEEEVRLAHRLLGSKNALDLQILRSLVGRPRRYSELQPLLGRTNDNNLNMALHRLRRDGLIRQRRDLNQAPPALEYELSSAGIRVYELTVQVGPLSGTLELLRRVEGTPVP